MICCDQVSRRIKLKSVIVQIGNEPAQLTRPDAASVTPQLNGVEIVAEVSEVVRDMGLEEVVVPAVQVEDRAREPVRGPALRINVATSSTSAGSPGAGSAPGSASSVVS